MLSRGNFVGVEGFYSVAAYVEVSEISIMDDSAMDM